jgi:hypothetical protein
LGLTVYTLQTAVANIQKFCFQIFASMIFNFFIL